jgi:multidrug efflux pump subunit AcrA (membrane-fusion protein)
MAVPYGMRFDIAFDDMFPQGAFLMGDVQPLAEYQSQEDKARNRPVRPRIDEQTGKRLYRATIADPAAEKERDKSIAVEIAADVQPVPPETVGNLPFRPVVLEGLTVQPRAETSGQAKWITWVVRATGLRAVDAPATRASSAKSTGSEGKSAA